MKRKLGLTLVFGAALPLAVASVAWACGVLTTLSVNTKVASPGQTVTVTGKNWSTNAGTTPVTIRLRSRTGQVLATTAVQPSRGISETFALPASLSPGWYVILATQFNANGAATAGTPGRTTVRIQGAASSQDAAVAAAPWGSSTPSGPAASAAGTGGSGSLLAIMLAATLSLTMLAGGWKLLSRSRSRSVAAPQFGV